MSYILKRKIRKYRKKFVLPVLTSNGTMGGSTFAVDCSTPKTAEYEMFNTGSAGTKGVDTNPNAAPQWVSFYNPVSLKVTQLRIGQIKDTTQAQYYYITAYKIQVSDDNQTWTDVYSGTGSKPATTLTANIADSGYHKYYRIYVTSAAYYSGYPRVFFFGIDFDAEAEDDVFYDDIVKSYVTKHKKRRYYKNTELFDSNIINGITSEIGTVSYSGNTVYQSNAWDCFGYTRIGFKTNTATGSGQSEITFNEVQPAGFYTFKADNTQNGTATFSVTFTDGTTQTLAKVTAGSTKVPVAETRIYLSKPVAKAKVAFTSSNWGWSGGWSFAKGEEVSASDDYDFYDDEIESYVLKRKVRKYYKYVSQSWTQPTLTADGTIGGDSFAVSGTNYLGAAFNAINDDNSSWIGGRGYPIPYIFYNPFLLDISKLVIGLYGDSMAFNAYELQISEDGNTWETIYSGNSGIVMNGSYQTFSIDLTGIEKRISKYWRINLLSSAQSGGLAGGITRLKITANAYSVIQEVSSTDDWDFYEDIEY